MDIEAHRDLKLLEAVEEDSRVTQRTLATKLGIALGLTNIYLKRLVRKGYIKCVNVQSNRLAYLITPRGVAEKARLTYEFMQYSLQLYKDVRRHLQAVVRSRAADGQRLAIYGWRQLNGQPIQPLTIVHWNQYVDYSHGVRLVRDTLETGDKKLKIAELLADPDRCGLVSDEGPMKPPRYPTD